MKTHYIATKRIQGQFITIVAEYYMLEALKEDRWSIERIKECTLGYERKAKK